MRVSLFSPAAMERGRVAAQCSTQRRAMCRMLFFHRQITSQPWRPFTRSPSWMNGHHPSTSPAFSRARRENGERKEKREMQPYRFSASAAPRASLPPYLPFHLVAGAAAVGALSNQPFELQVENWVATGFAMLQTLIEQPKFLEFWTIFEGNLTTFPAEDSRIALVFQRVLHLLNRHGLIHEHQGKGPTES